MEPIRQPAAAAVIDRLGLRPHPEGGWYAETWRAEDRDGARAAGSAILYLLAAGERSHWHRVDAAELWQHSAGDALELRIWAPGDAAVATIGSAATSRPASGRRSWSPKARGRPLARSATWALVGCIVVPAFEFDGLGTRRRRLGTADRRRLTVKVVLVRTARTILKGLLLDT